MPDKRGCYLHFVDLSTARDTSCRSVEATASESDDGIKLGFTVWPFQD